jgi:hypothetical protein
LGPISFEELNNIFVGLAVPPLSPTNDDTVWDFSSTSGNALAEEDALYYLETGLRASVRSSFNNIKSTSVENVGISTVTTNPYGSDAYQTGLKVVLETIIEESKLTTLRNVHLMAASVEEASYLIKAALETGLELQ